MYQPTPARQRANQRSYRWIAALPEVVYSPAWRQDVRLSPTQVRLLAAIARRPGRINQREMSKAIGYAPDSGALCRTLKSLERLGLIARSTTLGRFGSTVVWIRAGVRRPGNPLADLMREALGLNDSDRTDGRTPSSGRPGVRAESFGGALAALTQRGGPPRRLADILGGSA